MSGIDDVHGALARLTDATMARIAVAEMQRNEARERANRAEALLREVLTMSKCPAGASCSCCAAVRQSLLAKIRRVCPEHAPEARP